MTERKIECTGRERKQVKEREEKRESEINKSEREKSKLMREK